MSSIVSNPYSFNISKNTGFAVPSIAASLPNNDTTLKFKSTGTYGHFRTTIPDNVKVIKSASGRYIGVTPNKIYDVTSYHTMCIEGSGETYIISHNNVDWYYDSYGNDDQDSSEEFDPNSYFHYSASINNHAIDVADY